jgi:phosphatidylinositol-3-phosphatase
VARPRFPAAATAILLFAAAACSSPPPPGTAPPTRAPSHSAKPLTSPTVGPMKPTTIVLVIMENQSRAGVVGNNSMPFLNHVLVPNALSLTDMHGDGHPSLPNYVWMTAGRSCGAVSDGDWGRTCRSLFDQLDAAGIGWTTYAEGYPGTASTCSLATLSALGANDYARKHVPPLLFASTSKGAACTGHMGNFPGERIAGGAPPAPSFHDVALPPFTIVVPNLCHDMHNSAGECGAAGGGTAAADTWLRLNWHDLVADAGPRGAVILTWDEADGGDPPIPTFIGGEHLVGAGTTAGTHFDHASTLRAIEDALGLPCLAGACAAHPLPIGVGG